MPWTDAFPVDILDNWVDYTTLALALLSFLATVGGALLILEQVRQTRRSVDATDESLGLLRQESEERQAERNRDDSARFELALADVMQALGARHIAIESFLATPWDNSGVRFHSVDEYGGPADTELQVKADIAYMQVPTADLEPMEALAEATYMLKRATLGVQKAKLGEIVGTIRKWRTHRLTSEQFTAEMNSIVNRAIASENAKSGPVVPAPEHPHSCYPPRAEAVRQDASA